MATKKSSKSVRSSSTQKKEKVAKVVGRVRQAPAPKHVRGFTEFVREQGVVGLAIGLAIGTQAGATVRAIVDGFVSPIVTFLVGSPTALTSSKWNVIGRDNEGTNYWLTLGNRTLEVQWGLILASSITLVAVAAVIYFVVKGLKLDKFDKKKDK